MIYIHFHNDIQFHNDFLGKYLGYGDIEPAEYNCCVQWTI